jgi:hypothetical protein
MTNGQTRIGVLLIDILYDYVFASDKQLLCFSDTTWITLRCKPSYRT